MAEEVAKKAEQTTVITEKWCNTKCRSTKYVYTWAVDDFKAIVMSKDIELISMPFDEEFPRKLQWQLKIEKCNSISMSHRFCLILLKGDGSNVPCTVEFSILNPNEGKDYCRVKSSDFRPESLTEYFPMDHDFIMNDTKRMIYGGRLTVRFEISITHELLNDSGSTRSQRQDPFKLSEDLGRALEAESFSDVTLTVGSESFRAHKVVLAARSDVFAAMFQHEMIESSKNCVEISHIDPAVFRETLRFIYTGEVSEGVLEEMAPTLMAVADKYALDELKDICEKFLMQNLTPKIAADILIVADLHSADRLKARTIDFIKGNLTKVALTSGWFEIGSYAHLVEEFSSEQEN